MLLKPDHRQFGVLTWQELSDASEVGFSTALSHHQRINESLDAPGISEPAAMSSDGSSLGVIVASYKSTSGNFEDCLGKGLRGLLRQLEPLHGSALNRQHPQLISLHGNIIAENARNSSITPSWGTAIVFQSRYRSGMVAPKIGEAKRTNSLHTSGGPNCPINSSTTIASTQMTMILRIAIARQASAATAKTASAKACGAS
jgi:hypothetical protein